MKYKLLALLILSPTAYSNEEALPPEYALTQGAPIPRAGIPVFDAAGIAQMVLDATEQAQRFKQQVDMIRNQIEEAKNQLNEAKRQGDFYEDMVNTFTDSYVNALNSPSSGNYLAHLDWESIYNQGNDISSLRAKYGLISDDPKMQAHYDKMLQNHTVQETHYNKSVERQNRIIKLSSLIQSADTPAKKADLTNALEFERIALMNEQQMIALTQKLMEQQRDLETRARVRQSKQKLLKKEWE